jgi:diaminobutyrate-2-oxoglutarate transaminase
VVAFTNAFHGMTLGALAVTSGQKYKIPPEAPRHYTYLLPFPNAVNNDAAALESIDALQEKVDRGLEKPAAFIIETVQAEGGVNVASFRWLQRLAKVAKDLNALLIVDDIQVGCGRTGPFFSFEEAGITPDIVCLAKSLSGFGLPLALTLIRSNLDVWHPAEHNGTFRGNNHAFVTGAAALENFWQDDQLTKEVKEKSNRISQRLQNLTKNYECQWRGRGLIFGIELGSGMADRVSSEAFARGLIIETAGPDNNVLKLLPPLTTPASVIEQGLEIIEASIDGVLNRKLYAT